MATLLSNYGAPTINSIAAQRILANQVLENVYQGTIEDDGKGITQRFTEDCSGAQIRFIHVKPIFAKARELGASINGGNFPTYFHEGETDSFGLDVLTVLDDPIDLAQVNKDMIPVDLLAQYTKSYTDQVNLNINAMTIAGKLYANLLADAKGEAVNETAYVDGTDKLSEKIIEANAKLDDGVEAMGVSMFPTDDRICVIQVGYRAKLLKDGILMVGGANYGYDILKKGTIDAQSEARKTGDGFVGYIDNVPVHIASSLIFKVAGEYMGLPAGDVKKYVGYVSSGFANVRGIATPHGVKVIDNPNGQGVRIQPLTRMGFKVVEGYEKGNSFVKVSGAENVYKKLETMFSLSDHSYWKLKAPASRIDLSGATTSSSATTKITATMPSGVSGKIACVLSSTAIDNVSDFITAYNSTGAKKGVLVSGTESTITGLSGDVYVLFVANDGTCLIKKQVVA